MRPIRGNVDTRLRKLDAGEYDCLVLAGAGLERLGLGDRVTQVLRPPGFWPAIAQGALAIQVRGADAELAMALAAMDDPPTHAAVLAERSCLATLAGGCLAPIAGWGRVDDGRLVLGASVFGEEEAGAACLHAEESVPMPEPGNTESAARLGRLVAERLLAQGANEVLERVRRRSR